MKNRYYIYGTLVFFALIIVIGGYNRYRTAEFEEKINTTIDSISKPVEVAEIEKPPPLPAPPLPIPAVKSRTAPGSMLMQMRTRDDFMKRHGLSLGFPMGSSTFIKKAPGRETIYISQMHGNYTFWISVFENSNPSEIKNEIVNAFKLASDDLRVTKVNATSPFSIEAAYEFDRGSGYFITVVLQHPRTRKYLLTGFTSKRYNKTFEQIQNKLFLNLKPL